MGVSGGAGSASNREMSSNCDIPLPGAGGVYERLPPPNAPFPPAQGCYKSGSEALREEQLREELLLYIGERCCVALRPARDWPFESTQQSRAWVATLESFVEIRKLLRGAEVYDGSPIDGGAAGPAVDLWGVSTEGYAPPPFENREATLRVPHSDSLAVCSACQGRGGTPCSACEGGAKTAPCKACSGQGRLPAPPGERGGDRSCPQCHGSGQQQCPLCSSVGLLKCARCGGQGSLLLRDYMVVSWINVVTQLVQHEDSSCTVPQDKMFRVKGTEVHRAEDTFLLPANHPEKPQVERISADIFVRRNKNIPSDSRLIRERHVISEVPIVKSVLSNQSQKFKFYLVGTRRSVYLEDYPSTSYGGFPFGCLSFGTCKLI